MILREGADLKIEEVETIPDLSSPDNQKNWTELTAYDDYGNTIAGARSYFDDMGRPMQSQVKNLSAGILLASQPLYDQFGRPSLTTLSAPVADLLPATDNSGCTLSKADRIQFEHKTNFITTTSGTAYTYKNFDGVYSTAKEFIPDAIQTITPGTLGWFYSANNISSSTSTLKEPLVAKTDYPFAKTEFYNDGTQEVKSSVSPGNIYRTTGTYQHVATAQVEAILATDPDILKWLQMRASFNSVNPTSLIENAVKNKSIDEKGIETYSISDKSGKQIISVHKSVDPTTQIVTKTYAFNYYDDAGRLKYSITPNGVEAYFRTAPANVSFALIDKTSYEYNHRGWLLAINEPDAGRTEYKYRRDGVLRFSQNSVQRVSTPARYSYTNYDLVNRPFESGEYSVMTNGIDWADLTSVILEDRTSTGGLTGGSKSEIIKTFYDGENGSNTSPYAQDFVLGKITCTEKVGETKTWSSYDERGRIVWRAQEIPNIGIKKIEYTYDPAGNVKEVAYQRGQSGEAFYHVYEYDEDTRLKKVFTSTVTPIYNQNGVLTNGTEQAEYIYYVHGPLKRLELAGNLQGVDYLYTVEGWLKSINNYDKTKDPGGDANDVFGMTLEYYTGDYVKNGVNTGSLGGTTASDQFNGNIKASAWFSQKPTYATGVTDAPVGYAYTYDDKYQLKNAVWGNITTSTFASLGNSFREGGLAYDLNGNITTLQRYNGSTTAMHDFQYQYAAQKNQLTSVYNNITAGNYASYQYNAIGQLKAQTQGALTNYAHHDVRGMMTSLTEDEDGIEYIVKNYYDDNGLRYKKEAYDPLNNNVLSKTTWYVHDASGNVVSIYIQDINTANLPVIEETPLYGSDRIGIVFRNGNKHYYEMKDHLGNVRAVIQKDISNQLEVTAYTDYYPYGLELRIGVGADKYRYGYQGQYAEKDEETQWNAFELRMYDAAIGRWMGIDPYRQYFNPYTGMGNNPTRRIDPDGGWDGEYEKNAISGAWDKVSTKGDDIGVDFYHMDIDGKQITFVTDRNGNWNSIVDGRKYLNGQSRGPEIDWQSIYQEWRGGYGPERSIFEGEHPVNSDIRKNYLFKNAYGKFVDSGKTKLQVKVNYWPTDVVGSGTNMQAQMMGSYNVSFYKLGANTLTFAIDSKSSESFYLRAPVTNNARGSYPGGPFNDRETTTHQTYFFFK